MRSVFSRRFVPAALIAALLLSCPDAGRSEIHALRTLVRPGERAPAFALKDLDGKAVSFRPGEGRPALVVFWSVFCPMCRELTPEIDRFSVRHGAFVRVVGVNLDGKRFTHAVRSFLKEAALHFPVGLDDLRGDFFIASDPFGVEKTPTVVLVDGSGIVRGAWAAERIREFLKTADSDVAKLKKGPDPGK